MVASSKDSGTSNGVIANHAYMVSAVFTHNGITYVRLYNPWNHDGQRGAMFDLDSNMRSNTSDEGLIHAHLGSVQGEL